MTLYERKVLATHTHNNIQTVTGVEVTIGNCFPDGWEILPDAKLSMKAICVS